jgi:uncharacterized protein YjdB
LLVVECLATAIIEILGASDSMSSRLVQSQFRRLFILTSSLFLLVGLCPLFSCGGSGPGAIAAISVSPATSFLAVNAQQTYTATAQDSKGKTVPNVTFTWTSNAPDVASITTTGVATAHTIGTSEITASSSGITSAAATLNVIQSSQSVASVTLSPTTATIKVGATQQFTATAKDASGNTITNVSITWNNSAAGVAILSTSGLATGTAPGTALITASVGSVTSPVATLTVTP